MNSNEDFCKNVCALMAKLNQGLNIQNSFQFIKKSLTTDY